MTATQAVGETRSRVGGAPPTVVQARLGEHPRALLARAGLGGGGQRPVIVVCGGADELRGEHLSVARSALGPAIRGTVALTGAAVVDGGTAAGVMELLGAERARDPSAMPTLLGVAPAGRVQHPAASGDDNRAALEPNHTHFILADSDQWGGETSLLAALADELACGARVVMVVAGGGKGTQAEVQEAMARHWPLFAIDGTGGVAE